MLQHQSQALCEVKPSPVDRVHLTNWSLWSENDEESRGIMSFCDTGNRKSAQRSPVCSGLWSGVCVQVRQTDQCTESLRWVSAGDPRGVNSDLHHLLHVGWGRLTGVKLRPRLWATQRSTDIKLTPSTRQQEGEEGEGVWEGHDELSGKQEVQLKVMP